MILVRTGRLVEFDGPIGKPSVDEVDWVPLLGRSLMLTVTVVPIVEVTLPVGMYVLLLLVIEAEGDEVEFEGLMGEPEVADPDELGAPQVTVPCPCPGGP